MTTFKEANRVRTTLKMKLANFAWYKGSTISALTDGWEIVVFVNKIDNKVKKVIPQVVESISVKTELE